MFVAKGLLYVHLPRTGGTFVSNVLERQGIGSRQLSSEVDGHDGIRLVPETTADTTLTFATLRDPWSWYASVYAHYRHKGRFDGALHEYFGNQVSFKDVIQGLTHPADYPKIRLDHDARYPGARIPEPGLPGQLARGGIGLYTWMVIRMLCRHPLEDVPGIGAMLLEEGDLPWGVNAIVDTSQLRDGLCSVIQAWNPEVAPGIVQAIQSASAENKKGNFRGVLATGMPDPGIYDAEMQEWVIEADEWIFRRFGFAFPVGHPARPAVHIVDSGLV